MSLAIVPAALATGCATAQGPSGPQWPDSEVTPQSPPEDLDQKPGSTVLRRGSDGHLYAVGGLPDDVETGSPFLARYSGDWPLQDVSRPPLAAGRVVRLNDKTALVHLSYQMPDSEIADLEVTFEKSLDAEAVGKGISRVTKLADNAPKATLSFGRDPGVQSGDIYGLFAPGSSVDKPVDVQLSRRFKGICIVESTSDGQATCGLRSTWPSPTGTIQKGDQAIFLQHTFQKSPRSSVVRVGQIAGSENGAAARDALVNAFKGVAGDQPNAKISIETAEHTAKATRNDFHRVESEVEYPGKPSMFVGAEITERDGEKHLVVNYTGVGPVTGPGMVAAPPTGGVDVGPVDELSAEKLRPFAHVVWSALLVYRGDTAYALDYLHELLSTPQLEGPLRWHARDQYAMRWGALGNYAEAMWLVQQDRAIARADDDREARLNAFGTLVRLYDFAGLSENSVEAAREYLDAQKRHKPDTRWLSAVGMLAELQAANGNFEQAQSTVDTLTEACPDGCSGDLFSYLTNIWWSVPADADTQLAGRLLSRITELAQSSGGQRLAASRLYQGVSAMREESYDQALIGFLESARLYKKVGYKEGVARAKYFEMIAEIQREKNQNAFEAGKKALELRRKLRDFEGVARVYQRMSTLFSNIDFSKRPGPYLRSARSILTNGYKSQRARGSWGKAGESLYTLGAFLFKFGQHKSAESLFRKAAGFAISATRFDIAAMCHLHLAMVARRNKDQQTFRDEIERA
ncbi:MAG: hypothetical protein ABEN55_07980, partial [Bradymonadaceae bacterium]